jgi:leucyl-tRNA synthetase
MLVSPTMNDRYSPAEIEPKWQQYWEANQTFRAERRPGRPKFYALDMFPYPSGSGLHVGHPEGYTATDIICRKKRMDGYDVLHPMGWDAFGLPAEQYAIQTGTHPRDTTQKNITTFRRQMRSLGFSYDWSREVDTTDPKYVRWTQWIFLQLFKKGLAYQDEIPVNWCKELGTVLANEEVIDGRSERGNYPVERIPLRQWTLRITEYADRLDQDLTGLDWPETREKQRHWIGRSEGTNITFAVQPVAGAAIGVAPKQIHVFTTRVDTLAGATYVVLAPEHPLLLGIATAAQQAAVDAYASRARNKSDRERSDLSRAKTGVFTGAYALNPLTGAAVPVWVGDYVIGTYGTGAVMAVPAHDSRDHAFARTYDLPIVQVVARIDGEPVDVQREAFTDYGVSVGAGGALAIADGTPTTEAKAQITAWLAAQGAGSAKVTYKLRDWVFSRQRYWGEPIPVYFPVECVGDPRVAGNEVRIRYDRPIAVEEHELPLALPETDDFKPTGDPSGPLARALNWRFFQRDGAWFARETNTMPQWAGSCWYYLRYLDPQNETQIFSEAAYDAWMPVDLYVGGAEHAVLHLLYARFWHKALFDIGVVKHAEPFQKLVHQGLILGSSYRYYEGPAGTFHAGDAAVQKDDSSGEFRLGAQVVEERFAVEREVKGSGVELVHAVHGVRVVMFAERMSKSRGNVVNPDDIVRSHGADALRLYEMFMGPLEQVKPWQTSGIEGVRRFLDRAYAVCTGPLTDAAADDATLRLLHKTIQKIGADIDALRLNTCVSALMILVKHLGGLPAVPRAVAKQFVLILSPLAPHLGEELWSLLGGTQTLAYEPWPAFDPALVVDNEIEIGVQVNGKARSAMTLAKDAPLEVAQGLALADARVAALVEGKTIKKWVYVPGKILNLIVG